MLSESLYILLRILRGTAMAFVCWFLTRLMGTWTTQMAYMMLAAFIVTFDVSSVLVDLFF